ncbi:MAG TPA: bifunctional phosphoribosylaminoimidazolecarboxamide formyltransferase/IMP cyclohydrolase [Planctomycetota bacterium]|nr:bifunctional phosphoribosylaminoimidazolecarboxamide formyltransferase/IMP cyclohydrolase [Planctomycetota bacterium]
MRIQTALLSVFDKAGIVDFARALALQGVEILSTGGTARVLREAGIKIVDVSDYTGSPEIMDGRVKTLHPKIHGGILCVRDSETHRAQAEKHGIRMIDLVVVNLYPFREVVAKPDVAFEEAIENIDIGGPSMIRSAAKNHKYVTVVTEPSDYARVADDLRRRSGATSEMLRRELAVKAFAHTARYDAAIASFLGGREEFPDLLTLQFEKVDDLRYGENPHQRAALYRAPVRTAPSVAFSEFLGGKELSYNNLLDLDSAFELARELRRHGCVIVKHNNPCGAGCAETAVDAFRKALAGDPVSAYGGLVAFNGVVDLAAAEALASKENFFEGIIAPQFARGAVDILRERTKWGKNLRILEAGPAAEPGGPWFQVRAIRDGLLIQSGDDALVAETKPADDGEVTEAQKRDLDFAWTVCKHVRSNAIVLAKDEQVVGVGAGQMSRLDSAWMAVRKAGDRAKGAVAASDAFFPFPDALETLMDAGVAAAIQPGGSIRDAEVLAAAKKRNVPVLLTGMRHFKH